MKVEFHFGELFPRVGFIVPNLSAPTREGGAVLQQAWYGWPRYVSSGMPTHPAIWYSFPPTQEAVPGGLKSYVLGKLGLTATNR